MVDSLVLVGAGSYKGELVLDVLESDQYWNALL